jgi:hypothetical protein
MLGRSEPQESSMGHPVPDIEIKASLSIDPFLHLLRKMGVAEDDDLKPL